MVRLNQHLKTLSISPYKYVHETVWLPTYAVITLLVMDNVHNSYVALPLLIVVCILCRMLLELMSRLVFGDGRLTLRTGLLLLVFQLLSWGIFMSWFLQWSAKT